MYFNIFLYSILLISYNNIEIVCGFGTNDCIIEGLKDVNWLMGYKLNPPINDTHRGVVASIKTRNVKSMKVQNVKYLDARMEKSYLIIFTTEAFENFEEEVQGAHIDSIRIEFKFECNNGGDTLSMSQKVIDINNHDPIFSQEIYEYNFGTAIPEQFDLTSIFPISASDGDFTNYAVSFSFKEELSKNFLIKPINKNWKHHHLTLKTKTNLTIPFREEFFIVVLDQGIPPINTTAKIVVTVDSILNEETKKKIPYFSRNLYYGNYTSNHQVKMNIVSFKEIISNNINIVQSDYTNNFRIYYDMEIQEVKVDVIQPLSSEDLNIDFVTIPIEAKVEELDVTANTVLILFMPKANNDTVEIQEEHGNSNNNNCLISFPNSSHHFDILPTIIFFVIVMILVFCTMMVFLITRKNQITRSESFQIVHDGKLKLDG